MQIQQMFAKDINRYINGVVSVGEEGAIKQELEEYVVTRELQRHFDDFFDAYERGLDNPSRNVGVWIQGYFGSGKSHFLKMLSYLLENRQVAGRAAVDYFDGKFDDEMTYAKIRRAADVRAETILFNIDEKGGGYKEGDTSETAVLRSIARVFYEHLGFYGRDYKLARFEKMIDDRGKTDEFRAAYEKISGTSWLDDRESYDMFGEEVAQAANQSAGLSLQSVVDWAESTSNVTVDFGELVADINEYAERRERECGGSFRMLFMVDEMGQYLNGDVSRMLNLQTLVEQFCDKCAGRVWMVVTSQEAIDEMVSVVSMDFSKIQGRFSTRLSLSSSSVDEVIKKRVLQKTDSAAFELREEYQQKSAVLKNLFSFEDSRGDLKGYSDEADFVASFPFVGYQFTLMPSVLKEIRKHGYQGKSLSTGERSMLSSYQEAAQAVEDGAETALVPFWRFFDTLEKEFDHGIKQVFERCRRAAEADQGVQVQDLRVLKALYLINYLNDVKPTVGNIAILLVDDMDVDKVALREQVKASLDRLVRENYVSRSGERYSFLTDEEQDVAREIRDVQVDPSQVVEELKRIVFDKLFTARKYRKGANDFPFDCFVDGDPYGKPQNGMKLNIVTVANAEHLCDAADAELDLKSSNCALVVLDAENDYYDVLHNAARIRKYVNTNNVQQFSQSKQGIVKAKQEEAAANRKEAEALVSEAIVKARVSVNGRSLQVPAVNPGQKLGAALDELVGSTFTKAALVDAPVAADGDLRDILATREQRRMDGLRGNAAAANEMEKFLSVQARTHQPTSVGDVQRRFRAAPYGWREIDVAAVIALLVSEQRVMVSCGGEQVSASNPKMVEYLRKAALADKVVVRKREAMPTGVVNRAKQLLRELDGSAQVPSDEDGLVQAVKSCLGGRAQRYRDLHASKYRGDVAYPGDIQVEQAIHLASVVLGQQADAEAFLREFNAREDELLDNAEALEAVERFFETSQLNLFDEACGLLDVMRGENAYVGGDAAVQDALAKIREIVSDPKPYGRIHELRGLTQGVWESYGKLVEVKRHDVLNRMNLSLREVEEYAEEEGVQARAEVARIMDGAKLSCVSMRERVHDAGTCSQLDALSSQLIAWHETQLKKIDNVVAEALDQEDACSSAADVASASAAASVSETISEPEAESKPARRPKPKTKVLSRSEVLPTKLLRSAADVDAYVADFRQRLIDALASDDCDSIRLSR